MSQDKKPFSFHSLAVALAVCSLAILGAASIALFVAPSCSTARLTGWTFLGLSKDSWEALSTWFGFMAVGSGVLYLVVKRRDLMAYLRGTNKKPSREAGIAVVITAILAAGSVGEVGPFAALMRWHEVHKHHGTAHAASHVHGCAGHGGAHGECGGGGCGAHGSHGECEGGSCGDHGACESDTDNDQHPDSEAHS